MKIKNWSSTLIGATILISVVRYAGAFMVSDLGQVTGWLSDLLTFFLTLTGLGMGILDTLGGGLLFNGWRKVMPKTGATWSLKFKILTGIVFGLVFSGMVILVPFTISRIAHESIVDALGGVDSPGLWLWAGMVNVIPYLLIAGIFTGNRMVEDLESDEKVSGTYRKVSDWRRVRPTLSGEEVTNIAYARTEEIMSAYHVEERTARNYRQRARDEINIPR